MKDKSNGKERDYYSSKEGNFSPSTAPETNKFKGSPPRARLSSPDKEDQNRKRTDRLSKDRDDSSEARHTKKHKKSKKKKKSKDKDRHRESGSSDGDSDKAAEMRKKKKKRRHRDSDAERDSPDAARSHRNRSSEERESRKRHHSDRDLKHDNGFPPEKRRCIDYTDGSGGHLLPSNHTRPANGSSYGHLNGQPGYSQISGSGFSSDLKH